MTTVGGSNAAVANYLAAILVRTPALGASNAAGSVPVTIATDQLSIETHYARAFYGAITWREQP